MLDFLYIGSKFLWHVTTGTGTRNRTVAHYRVTVVMLCMVWGKQYQAYLCDVYPSSDQYSIRNDNDIVSIIPEH